MPADPDRSDQPPRPGNRRVLILTLSLSVLLGGAWWATHHRGPARTEGPATRPPNPNPLRSANATNAPPEWKEEFYTGGAIKHRSAVSNQVLNGVSKGWYTNGQLQVQEYFSNNVSHGLRTKWYPDGTKLSEAEIVDGHIHGRYSRWYEDGTLAIQASYRKGEPHGTSRAYYPSGCLKAEVEMADGKETRRSSYKDGELKPLPIKPDSKLP